MEIVIKILLGIFIIHIIGAIYYDLLNQWTDEDNTDSQSLQDKKCYETIVRLLKDSPDKFTSIWFDGTPQESLRGFGGKIIIMINDGHLINPNVDLTDEQEEHLKELVEPIAEQEMENYLSEEIFTL